MRATSSSSSSSFSSFSSFCQKARQLHKAQSPWRRLATRSPAHRPSSALPTLTSSPSSRNTALPVPPLAKARFLPPPFLPSSPFSSSSSSSSSSEESETTTTTTPPLWTTNDLEVELLRAPMGDIKQSQALLRLLGETRLWVLAQPPSGEEEKGHKAESEAALNFLMVPSVDPAEPPNTMKLPAFSSKRRLEEFLGLTGIESMQAASLSGVELFQILSESNERIDVLLNAYCEYGQKFVSWEDVQALADGSILQAEQSSEDSSSSQHH